MEPALIGAISGVVAATVTVATFVVARQAGRTALSERVTKAQGTGDSALQVAAEVENGLKDCMEKFERGLKEIHERVTIQQASFSHYRETAIEKFVTHNAITELEKRLVESQTKSEQRLIIALEGLNKRLDRLLEPANRRGHS